MKIYIKLIWFLWLLFPFTVLSQNGIIRGTVIDAESGEPLIGVSVLLKGTTDGTATDFDGKFEFQLNPGIYELQISYISYQTINITGVTVREDEVALLGTVLLNPVSEELDEIVVTAEAIRKSEVVLLLLKKKSAGFLDGISSENFKKIGDSNAATAIKRVTGVSVEGGKYLYVRGLGDRYTKTMLNGVDIPGLDPDVNSMQLDIFPTSLIDNMIVFKSFVTELQADFTGGVVNIETTDFPEEKVFEISADISYTPGMHFNNNFLTYQGGSTDFLGFDDGTRSLPLRALDAVIPSPVSGDPKNEVNTFLNEFNPTLGASHQTSLMNYSLGLTLADQLSINNNNRLGYILSLSYKRTTDFFEDVIYGEYQRVKDASINELRYATIQNGSIGKDNVLIGGLGGLTFKTQNSKFKLTAMHLQNGESTAGQFLIDNDGEAVGQSGYIAFSNNLEYNQRGLTNILLNGTHHSNNNNWEVDWRVSPTFSKITDPDIRKAAFTLTAVDTFFSAGAGGNPNRIWRYLDEINLVGKLDIIRNYNLFGESAKFRIGASQVYKKRDYENLSFDVQFFGAQPEFHAEPNKVLTNEHLYPNGTIYYSSGNNDPNPNSYSSNVKNTGVYVSNEFNPLPNLKTILGLRGEKYIQRHTGRDIDYANSGNGNNLENAKVLDAFDLFPSVSLIFSPNPDQNIRIAYSKTIARPSFKELSYAQILDPITNRYFNGGLYEYSDWNGNLRETRISNYDIRWEQFMNNGQLLSISMFYKTFNDPIELVRIPEQATTTEYQPRNVGDGYIVGAEIELRKTLDFLSESLRNFSITSNLTFVQSSIDMTDTEYNSRKNYEKEGETIKRTREMAGQAPYIINLGLAYQNAETGLEAGIFYNVKGSTLYIVGGGLFPDVFVQPFHSLNFNLNKAIGQDKRSTLNLNISNIIGDIREEVYTGYKAQNQYFTKFNPRTSFSIGLNYSI